MLMFTTIKAHKTCNEIRKSKKYLQAFFFLQQNTLLQVPHSTTIQITFES